MYATAQTLPRQTVTLPRTLRPLPVFERRERGFGVGYGNSSGYASDKRYAPATGTARFRFA
ncbi:hypothetical protein [Luteimonas kalidii]|uniref:Uncharacterized protein n=1 Tax=Luteimonas kalidii TaxID=3042025 RepID=A0ABT6JRQ2_9GAMM|nr:hypothetical protein [Luteimonas kalidii]MDH5833362.1 hypothetical protein [Luteimonas kalidii]